MFRLLRRRNTRDTYRGSDMDTMPTHEASRRPALAPSAMKGAFMALTTARNRT